jgi:hypothetical protein
VEDNCWIGGTRVHLTEERNCGFNIQDNEDFVEEFNRMRFYGSSEDRTYICMFCEEKFDSSNDTINHIRDQHVVEYTCSCGSNFEENEDHLLKHVEERVNKRSELESKDVVENLVFMLKTSFSAEKIRKIGINILLVDNNLSELEKRITLAMNEFEVAPKYHNLDKELPSMCAYKGLLAFSKLDCSKDVWLTDKEWQSVRLRVLKEKLLFYV